tara:strand:- start:2385 stop:2921 length:537 start_codon:yes stop_codon:yes gene_type:complete
MKLVIQTQFKENYGAHDWDGEGECPQYWKFKGGETYVFPNLIPNDVTRIRESGIPTLGNLIESKSDYSEEYILDWTFEDDDAVVCEHWESPWILEYSGGKWSAKRIQENDGLYHNDIKSKCESYFMGLEGDRISYSQEFKMSNGDWVTYQQFVDRNSPVIETEYDGMEIIEPVSMSMH